MIIPNMYIKQVTITFIIYYIIVMTSDDVIR